MFKVFIGYDPREHEAAEVCKHSILKHSTLPVQIEFLKQQELRDKEVYWREADPDSSTEFTFTRFLVPYLCNYTGYAVFVDCDFVFVDDIRELFQELDTSYAVQVVKHNYKPKNTTKMDGQAQHQYPRKNWSSCMLFNCGHPATLALTPELVNKESGQHLHRFEWLDNQYVGTLSRGWNWLVNWYREPEDGTPRAIHYTEGGPWFDNYKHTEYGWHYAEALYSYQRSLISPPPPGQFDHIPPEVQKIYQDILTYRVDPGSQYHNVTLKDIQMAISDLNNNAVLAVEADTVEEASDKLEAKGQNYDPFLKSFIMGAGGQITVWTKAEESQAPCVFRGVTKRKQMMRCREQGRDFYYIDTGYFGNGRKKTYHRITKNDMQYLGPVKSRPRDRLAATGWTARKFRPGSKILLAPPSQKLLLCYDIDLDRWLSETIDMIKLYTDREIIVRNKQSRSVRQSSDTMEMALEKDIHCLITFSSIAAVEAVLLGKPAITLGPSAAWPVASQSLKDIEKLFIPTQDEVEEWAAHLAYCQFTEPEMKDGTAWRILNDDNS